MASRSAGTGAQLVQTLLHELEHLGVEHPVLQHLRRRLDKVQHHAGACLAHMAGARQRHVHRVAKLVQQGLHLLQRSCPCGQGSSHQGGVGVRYRRVALYTQRPDGRMVVLAIAREQVT